MTDSFRKDGVAFRYILGGIVLLFVAAIIFFYVSRYTAGRAWIQEGEAAYHSGEAATTIAARKDAFNGALSAFLEAEQRGQPRFGNGKLYYAIGNTYFQLGEYPLAVLYYERAQGLMPREDRIQHNLALAEQKLGIHAIERKDFLDNLLLNPYVSLPERLQLFFLVGMLTLLSFSIAVWKPHGFWKIVSGIGLFLLLLLVLNLGATRYFSPVRGVLVHSAELRRGADQVSPKVGDEPVPAGTTVEVLDVSKDSAWLKVIAPGGELGFVPERALRAL